MAATPRRNGRSLSTEDDAFQHMGSQFSEPVTDPFEAQEPQQPRMPTSVSSGSPQGQMLQQRQPYQRTSAPGLQAPNTLGPTLSNTGPTQMTGRPDGQPAIPSYPARDTAGTLGQPNPSLGPSLSSRTETGGWNGPNTLVNAMSGSSAQGGGQGYTTTGYGGVGGGSNVYTGFDFNQSDANRDTGKSAKYAFADLAAKSGAPMPTTKQGAEEWARQYIVPGMNALGHEILDVKGDKMLVRNWQGEGWVDFLVNADGSNPQLAWQAEGAGGGGGGMMGAQSGIMAGAQQDPYTQLSGLQAAAMQGDTYSQRVLKYLMEQLGLDQSMMNGSMPQGQ